MTEPVGQETHDLFADDMEPKISSTTKTYTLIPPNCKGYEARVWAKVEVFPDGYCELNDWRYYDQRPNRSGGYHLSRPEDAAKFEAMREIWSWLEEWEFVELRQIGPEDSEYFATEKLEVNNVRSN